MPQNIYDNSVFFEHYKKLREDEFGLNNLIEQPTIYSLLPEVKNKSILDIGCGFGNFCRYVRSQGAAAVLGVDPSTNMLTIAKQLTDDPFITFQQAPIETFNHTPESFDVIVSSAALHYIEDFSSVVKKIVSWLKPQGTFIFSVEHPICTSYSTMIVEKDQHGEKFYPIYNYRDEKMYEQSWYGESVIKYHRTLSTYMNTLLDHSLTIAKVMEPMPTDEFLKKYPKLTSNKIRPPLLVIKSIKNTI